MTAIDSFREILQMNRMGQGSGIYSVCSAHETVLKAGMLQAKEDDSIMLIESTPNQVNQDGGYTGMGPQDFVDHVNALAREMRFDSKKILLGGDHLGPHTWQHLPSRDAMDRAKVLVREYVKAGYQKIHLDASMFLADDTGDRAKPLSDEIVAAELPSFVHRPSRPGKKSEEIIRSRYMLSVLKFPSLAAPDKKAIPE